MTGDELDRVKGAVALLTPMVPERINLRTDSLLAERLYEKWRWEWVRVRGGGVGLRWKFLHYPEQQVWLLIAAEARILLTPAPTGTLHSDRTGCVV